jgi:hypothetical protein
LVVVIQQAQIKRQQDQIYQLRFRLEIEVHMREQRGIFSIPIIKDDFPLTSSQVRAIMEQQ